MLILFFGIAHSWLNLWADILGFADKSFYNSFWTTTTPSSYIKSLIYICEEFFDYVFRPFFRNYFGETLIKVLETLLFGFILDYGLYYALGFFCPVLLSLMIFAEILSVPMKLIKHRSAILINFLLTMLGFGVFFLMELGGYYIVNSNLFPKNENLLFWNIHSIIFFK